MICAGCVEKEAKLRVINDAWAELAYRMSAVLIATEKFLKLEARAREALKEMGLKIRTLAILQTCRCVEWQGICYRCQIINAVDAALAPKTAEKP